MVKNNIFKIQSGFTLLEILVAISIIALILSLGIVSYNQVFISSRDSTRKSDLQIISNALEQYNNSKGSYPTNTSSLSVYLNPIPKDPKTNQDYTYNPLPVGCSVTVKPVCISYNLTTTLENNSEIYTINPYGKK